MIGEGVSLRVKSLFIVTLLVPGLASAETMTADELRRVQKGLEQVRMEIHDPCGNGGEASRTSKVGCAKLTEDYCRKVWDPAHQGNLTSDTSKIFMGTTGKSELAMRTRIDLEALVDAQERLPADLRLKAKPILERLKAHLQEEKEEQIWHRSLGRIQDDFWDAVTDIARERAYARNPELRKTKEKDRNFDQKAEVKAAYYDLHNEVTRAKYEKHPNWKRVERLFPEIKKALQEEVARLAIPADLKAKLIQKVAEVELSLPFEDPRSIKASEFGDQINAFYDFGLNKFTVCRGWFNAIQDDGTMVAVIAHELGHSIDPTRQANLRMAETPIGKTLSRLCQAQGPVFPCDEWKKLRETVFKRLQVISEPRSPFSSLTKCLKSDEGLEPFETEKLREASQRIARASMERYASDYDFTALAQPVRRNVDGSESQNDYYFRPDRLKAYYNNGLVFSGVCGTKVTAELFTQILECQGYRKADQNERGEIFESALNDMEDVRRSINEHWISYCGRNCRELVEYGLGQNIDEETADWFSRKVLERFSEREQDPQKRREFIAAVNVSSCDQPGIYFSAGDLTQREKKWSSEPHPDTTSRRLFLYSEKMAELIQCERDETVRKAAGSCEL